MTMYDITIKIRERKPRRKGATRIGYEIKFSQLAHDFEDATSHLVPRAYAMAESMDLSHPNTEKDKDQDDHE